MGDETRERIVSVAGGLLRFRFRLAGLAFDLERFETVPADEIADAEPALRANLEDLLVERFDPLMRELLAAAGDPRAILLEVVLDLAGLQHRLQTAARDLPRSPDEDAMIEGEIEPDLFTEIRTTINAVNDDQLDLAIDNLLAAAGYKQPSPRPPSAGTPRSPSPSPCRGAP